MAGRIDLAGNTYRFLDDFGVRGTLGTACASGPGAVRRSRGDITENS
jgi:hypothetical protein